MVDKKCASQQLSLGAQNQAGAESDAESRQNKKPENRKCFRGVNQHIDPRGSCRFTFYYPDYTVGSGITPDHALCSDDLSRYYKMLVGFTTDREFTRIVCGVTLPRRLLSCVVIITLQRV
jgi:hypothetical protein